ncbi:hypothetical protein ADJ73_09590 [Arsenicicoccus sp. oral taxon 190]|nr:hypothetical protein ADJ73_09590 [Arsenicicoccus sp. oral taxon 190]
MVGSSLGLSVVGLLTSAYLSYEHRTGGQTLACPEGQVVSCATVTRSAYATVLGMPVAYLGLLYFVALVLLCLPAVWRRPRLDLPRLAMAAVGLVAVCYLVWAEVQLGAICLWCTLVHVVTLLLLLVLVFGRALLPSEPA